MITYLGKLFDLLANQDNTSQIKNLTELDKRNKIRR